MYDLGTLQKNPIIDWETYIDWPTDPESLFTPPHDSSHLTTINTDRVGADVAPADDAQSIPGPGDLYTTTVINEKPAYICRYVPPYNTNARPCGTILTIGKGNNTRNWTRHLSTVHGANEIRNIHDGYLQPERAIALKAEGCDIQRVTCRESRCRYLAEKKHPWKCETWTRTEKLVKDHENEFHDHIPPKNSKQKRASTSPSAASKQKGKRRMTTSFPQAGSPTSPAFFSQMHSPTESTSRSASGNPRKRFSKRKNTAQRIAGTYAPLEGLIFSPEDDSK